MRPRRNFREAAPRKTPRCRDRSSACARAWKRRCACWGPKSVAREVFVSYSQPDYDCATALVERLEKEGIECWIAPRDIAPSADWAAEIIDAISNARVMVLVFSASSNDSPQVRREVERAVHKQVSILPFRIASVVPSKSLEYFLSSQHWMDAFVPPREPHYARLCAYLKTQLAKTESSNSA